MFWCFQMDWCTTKWIQCLVTAKLIVRFDSAEAVIWSSLRWKVTVLKFMMTIDHFNLWFVTSVIHTLAHTHKLTTWKACRCQMLIQCVSASFDPGILAMHLCLFGMFSLKLAFFSFTNFRFCFLSACTYSCDTTPINSLVFCITSGRVNVVPSFQRAHSHVSAPPDPFDQTLWRLALNRVLDL